MLLAGRDPDHITRPDFLDRTTPAPCPAATRRHNQSLTKRVGVPRRSGARLERDTRADNACRSGRADQRIDTHRARKILSRSFAGRLRANSLDLHALQDTWMIQSRPCENSPQSRSFRSQESQSAEARELYGSDAEPYRCAGRREPRRLQLCHEGGPFARHQAGQGEGARDIVRPLGKTLDLPFDTRLKRRRRGRAIHVASSRNREWQESQSAHAAERRFRDAEHYFFALGVTCVF
jgi:hypothetical protein